MSDYLLEVSDSLTRKVPDYLNHHSTHVIVVPSRWIIFKRSAVMFIVKSVHSLSITLHFVEFSKCRINK